MTLVEQSCQGDARSREVWQDFECQPQQLLGFVIVIEKMGEAGRERVADLSWDPVVARLTAP